MRWVLSLMLALVAGITPLYIATGGFTVVTAEAARRQSVSQHPRPIQDAQMLDENGHVFSLKDALRNDGRVAIVNFFYSRCVSLCLAQGFVTQQLQRTINYEGLHNRIRLISISFDPRDQAHELNSYAQGMQADPSLWQFWGVTQNEQRQTLLKQFGITVVPAPLGDFQHNGAFHVVTPNGRLIQIIDLNEPGLALEVAKALATGSSKKEQP